MDEILNQLHAGLLHEHLRPLEKRLRELLDKMPTPAKDIRRRFRILHAGVRPVTPECFQVVGAATLARKRLFLRYYSRVRDTATERTISPQRLIFYRSNWYLEAWCHLSDGLRSFALDCVREAEILNEPAQEIDDAILDSRLGVGYGIFSGPATEKAVLKFTAEAARWVSTELWHPLQKQSVTSDGSLVLEVPYSHEREILMDVLRHGPDVEVLAPESLRAAVGSALERATSLYEVPKRLPARAGFRKKRGVAAG